VGLLSCSLPSFKAILQKILNRSAGKLLTCPGIPVTLTIDKKQGLTVTTGRGMVTDAEFIEARRQLLLHPDFDRIWDFHDVTESRVSEEIVARLVAGSPISEKSICRAVVVSERDAPMKDILGFIGRTRKANRRIAAFPIWPAPRDGS
jgi:hypothetical protein